MGRVLKKKTPVFLPQAAEKPAPAGLKDTGLEEGILNGRWKPGGYAPSQRASQVTWQLSVGYLWRGTLCSGEISLILWLLRIP